MPPPQKLERNQGYSYKAPRRVNWVSLIIIVGVVIAAYAAWAYGRVYWKAQKVDEIVHDEGNAASDITMLGPNDQRKMGDKVLADTVERIVALGINTKLPPEGNGLQVYFDQGYRTIHAKYTVTIKHPLIGKTSVLHFDRVGKIPGKPKF